MKTWAGDREGNFGGGVGRLNLLEGVSLKLSPLSDQDALLNASAK